MRGTEFAELDAFVAVAERGSFVKAAEYLGIAPSTLSQTIRSLEERLGVLLLHRTTRSVSLSEAGEKLLARVRPALRDVQTAVESINDLRDKPVGTLRLSVSSIPAQMILAPLFREFLELYPAIVLDITVDDVSSDIVSGGFDAGIRYSRIIAEDMLLVKVSPESRIVAFASPAYLARHAAPQVPQDLQKHPCIRYRRGNNQIVPWEFRKGKNEIEIQVNGPLIVNDPDLMVKATRDGIGIGYMVESYIAKEIQDGHLVLMLTDWSPIYHSYYLYYANRHQPPAPLKVFIEFLLGKVDTAR
jgi:DNA-binding transcriptional LysR family regulator